MPVCLFSVYKKQKITQKYMIVSASSKVVRLLLITAVLYVNLGKGIEILV